MCFFPSLTPLFFERKKFQLTFLMLGKPAAAANTQRCLYGAQSGDGLSDGERNGSFAQLFDEGDWRVWLLPLK